MRPCSKFSVHVRTNCNQLICLHSWHKIPDHVKYLRYQAQVHRNQVKTSTRPERWPQKVWSQKVWSALTDSSRTRTRTGWPRSTAGPPSRPSTRPRSKGSTSFTKSTSTCLNTTWKVTLTRLRHSQTILARNFCSYCDLKKLQFVSRLNLCVPRFLHFHISNFL